MSGNKWVRASAILGDVARLVERAARQGIALDATSAKSLALLHVLVAIHKLDGVCRLIRVGREDGLELSFRAALPRIEMCGGDAEQAIRRMLAGRLKVRDDAIPRVVARPFERGIAHTPRSVFSLDVSEVLSGNDHDGIIALGERIPDRSVDPVKIAIWREQLAKPVIELRRLRAERVAEYIRKAAQQ